MKPVVTSILAGLFLSFNTLPSVADEVGIAVIFSDNEVEMISAYYQRQDALSHQIKKNKKQKGLPPGIAKNLQRGKALPPGIAKQQLPGDLERTLPPAPSGHERVIIDGRVLLIEIATQVIHDVLMDRV